MADEEFFYCVRHRRVERTGDRCSGGDVLGPYPTEADAAGALEAAARRTKEWDDEDRAWAEGEGNGDAGGR